MKNTDTTQLKKLRTDTCDTLTDLSHGAVRGTGQFAASYRPAGPNDIVSQMHEAYRRVRLDETAYGCFMAGPSAAADIEATLVHGAQGARSLNVFFLPCA